jgi:BirA family biotin operon repressor/biotin-[acetyl-CoA-carboxylase] ligase
MSGAFDPTTFLKQLREHGCRLGEPFAYFERCVSTNDEAKRALHGGLPSGATFVADEQTAGRGRRGRQWFAPAGECLLFSVLMRPRIAPEQLSTLTLSVGLGVREALAQNLDQELLLKWPNDVLCDDQKLAGVLVECEMSSNTLGVIVGVGINVGVESFPEELEARSTSLRLLGSTEARELLLVRTLRAMHHWVGVLESGRLHEVVQALERYDALLGRQLAVDGCTGVGAGIDARGHLLLRTTEGVRAVHSGTVEIQ